MTRHPIAAAQPASPAAGPAATAAELDAHRAALSDPERGYVVLRGFLDPAGVERYRSECAAFLARGRVIHTRMNRDDLPDYVHPRTAPRPDGGPRRDPSRGPDTWRIYQFLHNAHSAQTQALFERVLSLRDAIEAPWRADPAWRAEVEAVHDYVQVTRYVDDCEGLPRHHDTAKDLPHPMLQPLMLLSRPGIDYQGGDLFVWTTPSWPWATCCSSTARSTTRCRPAGPCPARWAAGPWSSAPATAAAAAGSIASPTATSGTRACARCTRRCGAGWARAGAPGRRTDPPAYFPPLRYFQWRLLPSAIHSRAVARRRARVAGCFASVSHST